ncbi:MAG TPA: site-2 protease family protein [Chthoniobacterales bacterium]|nr:site-2 protease family protein [Chthoniobacterales bacterium]
MRWSFKVARIAGIDIRIHIGTFILLLGGFLYIYSYTGDRNGALNAVLIWVCVFICVLLHELGHAFAAKAYGITTVDITLHPLGGLARLERMPDRPWQELVVALAGPMVNVVIAAVLILVLLVTGNFNLESLSEGKSMDLLWVLLWINSLMFFFNLIPAFPLDGGRVLRALLATRMEYIRATQIAATIGQGLALAMGVSAFAIFKGNIPLILIAIFIYMGAENESAFVQMRYMTAGLPVSSAMVTRFDTLDHKATLNEAIDMLLGTSQHEFAVVDDNGGFAGLLTKNNLILALRRSGPETPVTEVMTTGLPTILPNTNFERALALVQQTGAPALPVVDNTGRLIGLFTQESVSEMLLVRNALGSKQRRTQR